MKRSGWARELYLLFQPAREALKDLSEAEINAEINAALHEVRGDAPPMT